MFVRIFFLVCLTFVSAVYKNAIATDEVWYVSPLNSIYSGKSVYLVNDRNEEVPYVLLQQIASSSTVQMSEPVQIIENVVQNFDGSSDRVVVLDLGKEGQLYTRLVIEPVSGSKNFNKVARVFISDSLLTASSPAWKEIEKKTVVYTHMGQSGLTVSNFKINFPGLTSRYIKVQFEENAKEFLPLQISSAQIEYDSEENTKDIYTYISGNFDLSKEDMIKEMELEENILKDVQSITRIDLQVKNNFSSFVESVTVESSDDCVVWKTVSTSTIYRIDSPTYIEENLTLKFQPITAACLRIVTSVPIEKKVQIMGQELGVLFKVNPVDAKGVHVRIDNSGLATSSYILQKELGKVGNIVPEIINIKMPENAAQEKRVNNPFAVYSAIFLITGILAYLRYKAIRKK